MDHNFGHYKVLDIDLVRPIRMPFNSLVRGMATLQDILGVRVVGVAPQQVYTFFSTSIDLRNPTPFYMLLCLYQDRTIKTPLFTEDLSALEFLNLEKDFFTATRRNC
jgi:hypothetical protein